MSISSLIDTMKEPLESGSKDLKITTEITIKTTVHYGRVFKRNK